jgi:hypothetical protein
MSVTKKESAPYTSPSAVMNIIKRFRQVGMAKPFTVDVLTRAGVTESLAPRTLQSLQALNLLNQDGFPTEELEGLRIVPEADFQSKLADVVRGAYADIFNFVDPSTSDLTHIRDAFRTYEPQGQQPRMVALFLGLCEEAGIPCPKPIRKERTTKTNRQSKTNNQPRPRGISELKSHHVPVKTGNLPSPIAGLIQTLPSEGMGWTKKKRDDFYRTFGVVLDFCYPIIEETGDEIEIEE